MLELNHVAKKFNKQVVLQDISLRIPDGSFTVITGVSGKGKTTLLNILGGLEKPDNGQVLVDGQALRSAGEKLRFYRTQAGFLFQNYALVEDKTVDYNLRIGCSYRKMRNKAGGIRSCLKRVGLEGVEKKKVYQLSGGEQQRVALARLLLKDPAYIFADEPTGNLDAENRDVVLEQLKQLNREGKTVVIVTHDPVIAEADCILQRIVL